MERELICTVCPLGCQMKAVLVNGRVKSVSGNSCRRGVVYARNELVAPRRMVTCAVPARNGKLPMGSLKTARDVPKEKIFDVIKAMKAACLIAPVTLGEVVIEDVADTGVPVVSTKAVPAMG